MEISATDLQLMICGCGLLDATAIGSQFRVKPAEWKASETMQHLRNWLSDARHEKH